MKDGSISGEFWYAYYAYHKMGMLPSAFSELPAREKAMIMAFTEIEAEELEKERKKSESKARRRRRR